MNIVSPFRITALRHPQRCLTQLCAVLRWGGCYLAYCGHYVLVLLSAEEFLDAEVQLLEQLLIGRQAKRRTQSGQQLAQLVPGRQVSRQATVSHLMSQRFYPLHLTEAHHRYLTLATGSWTSSSAGIRKCLLKYFLEKISVAVSQTSRNLRRFQ